MPGMTLENEEHLLFVLNRAANEVSAKYHDEFNKLTPPMGLKDMMPVPLLDRAIAAAAESLVYLVIARSKARGM